MKYISKFVFQIIIIFFACIININELYSDLNTNKSWNQYYRKGKLQFIAEMYDYSIFNLEQALNKNPSLYTAANLLAEIYIKKNKNDKAIKYFARSLKINNNQDEIHNKIGELYEFHAEYDLAFIHFKLACKINPNNVKSNMNLVRYYLRRKKNKQLAEKHFKISYNIGKINSEKFYNAALKEKSYGNYSKAIDYYKKTIKASPAMLEAYMGLCEIYRKQNKYVSAVNILEKLKSVRPDYIKAYVYLGNIYFDKKFSGKKKYYIEKAIKNLEKAIELNPLDCEIYYKLSSIYNFIGHDIKAKELEKKAIKLDNIE